MAMELARYVDDVPLTQEIALRLGNCLAPLLTSSRKSRLLVTALAQCVSQLRDTGAARHGAGETGGPAAGQARSPRSSQYSLDGTALRSISHDTSLFFRLLIGCIETKICNQIRIL